MGKADEETEDLQHRFQAGSGASDGGGRDHRGSGQGVGDSAAAALPVARQISGKKQGGAGAAERPTAREEVTDRFARTQCSRLTNC